MLTQESSQGAIPAGFTASPKQCATTEIAHVDFGSNADRNKVSKEGALDTKIIYQSGTEQTRQSRLSTVQQ